MKSLRKLSVAIALTFAGVGVASAGESVELPKKNQEVKQQAKSFAKELPADCFPVHMESACNVIDITWCGSVKSLMPLIDAFLKAECP